jgi:hypothetical protein
MSESHLGLEVICQTASCKQDRKFTKKCKSLGLDLSSCFVCNNLKAQGRRYGDHDVCRFAGMSEAFHSFMLRFQLGFGNIGFRHIEWRRDGCQSRQPSAMAKICFRLRDTTLTHSHSPRVFNRSFSQDVILEQLVCIFVFGATN